MDIDAIVKGIRKGDTLSVSRAISIVEDRSQISFSSEIMKKIYNRTGNIHIIGVTGPPGVGKSSMIGKLASEIATRGRKTSIIAVDASSPFTGGTLLGNRVRMQESINRNSIYMRSLASRGFKGGLSSAALSTIRILDAAGFDSVIVETVGSGQADIDIMKIAHTIVVLHAPGLGDILQSIKAGIMEIGDIFVVNKIDREGAFLAIKDIEDSLSMLPGGSWKRKVIGVNSLDGENIDALLDEIERHRSHGKGKRGDGDAMKEMSIYIEDELRRIILERSAPKGDLNREMKRMMADGIDPFNGALKLVTSLVGSEI
ncbi:MAG: methylmalonyl Co-A mutase-associated GTPase MeaB [Candidatus Thermoplasmatota archaeon]|nr:methylmalonyl Co-A mutase-associated GTPase MeaB [Candidatus Thermoplasmatota archaeon]MCL5800703.1 methylmalonyl Co-A mutase-associated GTPase MeaB [Candidatus Thermoplasmatota archaeon]